MCARELRDKQTLVRRSTRSTVGLRDLRQTCRSGEASSTSRDDCSCRCPSRIRLWSGKDRKHGRYISGSSHGVGLGKKKRRYIPAAAKTVCIHATIACLVLDGSTMIDGKSSSSSPERLAPSSRATFSDPSPVLCPRAEIYILFL